MTAVVMKDLLSEVLIIRLGQLGLLVQQGEDALRLGLHQVDAVLRSIIDHR